MKQFCIRSTQREEPNGFFFEIHSFTPFFSSKDKAKRFTSYKAAIDYARAELFTDDSAFEVAEWTATHSGEQVQPEGGAR